MAVMKSDDGNDLMVDCSCGCDEGLRIKLNKFDEDSFCIFTYTDGKFYNKQDLSIWRVIGLKLKKIWFIIRNKDYCYSEIILSKKDFKQFKEYLEQTEARLNSTAENT